MVRKQRRGGGESPSPMERPSSSSSSPPSTPEIIIPDSWSEAANSIAYGDSQPSPPIVFICGPKNSGKTTFSRHLVNTLLQRYRNVGYLDTDVGQPEFTPPGCLSLHVLREKTTDLSVLSLKTPVRCLFYGDISSKRDPNVYISSIFSLYDYFVKEYYQSDDPENPKKTPLPLVINTPGWVKGAGYELLVEMLRYFAPTHIVQLRISAESKNLPAGAFWLDRDQEASVNLIELYAARKDAFDGSVLIQKQSRDLRDIRIVAYFQQCIPRHVNICTHKELAHALASITPYEVPISRIKVRHLHCQVPDSEVFHSLNATIVGLAISSGGTSETEKWTSWCVGLGIVRGIDVSKDLLYIITPVPPCNLEKVDLLLQGFVQIPSCLLQVRGCSSPYMSTNVLNRLGPFDAQTSTSDHVFLSPLSAGYQQKQSFFIN